MLRITALLSSIAVTASPKEFFIRTMSAQSMAISDPAPMAIPISAVVRAGASFIPSPIKTTLSPVF